MIQKYFDTSVVITLIHQYSLGFKCTTIMYILHKYDPIITIPKTRNYLYYYIV